MWRAYRPDALEVLNDRTARSSLKRYFDVMEDRAPARFVLCRSIEVKADLSTGTDVLWKMHEEGMRTLVSYIGQRYASEKTDELPCPEVSLLDLKIELAKRMLKSCHFCERRCGVDRTSGKTGFCGVGANPRIASEFMHYGEEPELVPSYTLFFAGCTFRCAFCQNYDISQDPRAGVEASPRIMAKMVSKARRDGARNVNWVGGSPTPNLHAILEALKMCEVNIPSVWNSNFYMTEESMRLLGGTQDIYLSDFKYGSDLCASRLSGVSGYLSAVKRNHLLALEDSELIIRHLVMPGHIECCTRPVLQWISKNLGKNVRINVMAQYRPCYRAGEYEELKRTVTWDEMKTALRIAEECGMKNVIS
ncbi:MAG: radical SAM protein [Candidatus Hadarchaeales archaeon]